MQNARKLPRFNEEKVRKVGTIAFLVCLVIASMWGGYMLAPQASPYDTLSVKIRPDGVKLYFGETETFYCQVENGTGPFKFEWYDNRTVFLGNSSYVEFSFPEPTNYTILTVTVTDINGVVGEGLTYIFDPYPESVGSFYFDKASRYFHDYIIERYNSTCWQMVNGTTGKVDWQVLNDASYVINAAFGNLTTGGGVLLAADTFTINHTLTIDNDSNGILFEGMGRNSLIKNADNFAHTMMNITANCTIIRNMRFDGNKANALDGNWIGIEIYDGLGNCQQNTLDTLWIYSVDYNGVSLYGDATWGGLNYLHNLYIYYSGNHGIYTNDNTDNTIEDVVIQFEESRTGLGMDGCYLWYPQFLKRVHVIYPGRYAFNVQGDHSSLEQCYADTAYEHGFMIAGDYNTITDPKTTGNSDQTDDTYDDIYISGDYNVIIGSAYLFGTGNGSTAKWVIYESSAGSYNQIANVRCDGATTGQIFIQGTGTRVTDSYNGTSWCHDVGA